MELKDIKSIINNKKETKSKTKKIKYTDLFNIPKKKTNKKTKKK